MNLAYLPNRLPLSIASCPRLLEEVRSHYRLALATRTTADPVVVVEVLDRRAGGLDEAVAQVDAEDCGGMAVAVGVQSRIWVTRCLRPCDRKASAAVRRGGRSVSCPMTLVIVAAVGITVVDLECSPLAAGLHRIAEVEDFG